MSGTQLSQLRKAGLGADPGLQTPGLCWAGSQQTRLLSTPTFPSALISAQGP